MISLAKDFSDVPSGRFPEDGDFCGEIFRETILVPALRGSQETVVSFDGVEGLGSSFLEESFGGLVRHGYFTPEALKSKLRIVTTQPEFNVYVDLAWRYIDEAQFASEKPLAVAG